MSDGIEVVAGRAIKDFLATRSDQLVTGLTLGGVPVAPPMITSSAATPPTDARPFIAVTVTGRVVEIDTMSPISIAQSILSVLIVLRNHLEVDTNEDQTYESSNRNHSSMGDRIIGELLNQFKTNRTILDTDSSFSFSLNAPTGVQKNNFAAWDDPSNYVVTISEIVFSVRSQCEQETWLTVG